MPLTAAIRLDHLRRYAAARTFFRPTTLARAIAKLGFVQADPIRAPARAQDLVLRHRVKDYRAGDLEQRYSRLKVEEDFFVNYGFLPQAHHALMHPRMPRTKWSTATQRRAQDIFDFVCKRGKVHPREVDEHFAHGSVTNYWGGSSSASTHLLDDMHYRGMLRVVRRDNGTRVYAADQHAPAPQDPAEQSARLDALVDVIVNKYAPLPETSFNVLVRRLRYGAPQWSSDLTAALVRAKARLGHARIDGIDWYWPADERPASRAHFPEDRVRLLAPFDPVVWDRKRFELFWGWRYRFEAYTKAPKRKLGYYALPILWRDAVIGWGNLAVVDGKLSTGLGYVAGRAPKDAVFKRELEAELASMRAFLCL